ncbi:MAG: murein biosynthesis integral membrane protein MurJ [Jatrophihabitantaceae bacterium]
MTDLEDGWSAPSLHSSRGQVEPRMFTEADPMTSVLLADWSQDEHEPAWSPPTYVGRRRLRPGTRPAAETLAAVREQPADEQESRGLMADSRTMALASLVSRITGFLRGSMLVAAIGIHGVGDAYNVANNFPNMVYELLLGGVLSSVLIPLLVHAQEDDADGGVAYTQRLLSIATAALGAMTLVAVACAPLLASAFVPDAAQRSLTSLFATLLLPEIFFYGIGAMFMAVLNIRHSYGPGAWSPVLNNVVMIATIGLFWAMPGPATLNPATMTTPQILVLGIGTTLGIAAQALVLVPALRRTGFRWQWRFRARPNELGRMREVGSLAGWVLGYVVASQIGVTVIAKVGVDNHAFTVFTNADLLVQMPYGILVVSLLTALMPRLSRSAARGQTADVVEDLGLGARLSAIALLPITAGLIVLGPVLCVTLFGYGQTSVDGGRLIGTALAASAFGLFPFAMVMLQLRVFYAMRDGRTPTLINVFMVATKVLIVLVCAATIHQPAHIAEALTVATSASYVIGAAVGHVALTRRLGRLRFQAVARVFTQLVFASAVGGAAAWAAVVGSRSALGTGHAGSLAGLLLGGVAGLAVLAAVLWRLRIPEVRELTALARRG